MKYRIIENNNGVSYTPQFFNESDGWKLAYAESPFDKCSYKTIDEAKEACKLHALNQPKVVWFDEF